MMETPLMDEDDIFHMFFEAVDTFPPEHQKAAEDWLFKAAAALSLVHELATEGAGAVLFGNDDLPS
jgi:hypothetical protein